MKNVKKIEFYDEVHTSIDGWRYDGWLQYTLETGEIVSIPATYFKRKCKKCGEITQTYGLFGNCKACEGEK